MLKLLRVTVGKGLQIYTLADAYQGPVVLRCTLEKCCLLRVMVGKCNISWLMIGAMVPVVSGGEMDTDGH